MKVRSYTAKSMADRIDVGIISLQPSPAELKAVKPILAKRIGMPEPNLVQHIYKVRRGKITKIRLWQKADLGTCRTKDLFVTDNNYNLIPVDATDIDIDKIVDENSVDSKDIPDVQEEEATETKSIFRLDF